MKEFLKYINYWSVLKTAVYFFFYMLLIWGASNKFGKKEFHDDYASWDYYYAADKLRL